MLLLQGGLGSIPGQGTKILHALRYAPQTNQQKQLPGMGWIMSCPRNNTDIVTSSAYEYNLIWKWDLHRWNQVKIRSYWSKALNPIWHREDTMGVRWVLGRMEKTQRQRGDACEDRQRLEWCICKPKDCWGWSLTVRTRKRNNRYSFRAFRGNMAPGTLKKNFF